VSAAADDPRRSRRARLNTFFVRYGCRPAHKVRPQPDAKVSIPSSSGMGVGPPMSILVVSVSSVSIPSSSGMGVGRSYIVQCSLLKSLNTFFVRYGCRPWAHITPAMERGLNTFFVRYGCRPVKAWVKAGWHGLNTFFVRYGCRPMLDMHRRMLAGVSIPSSSGMGVGPSCRSRCRNKDVSIPSSSGMGVGPVRLMEE